MRAVVSVGTGRYVRGLDRLTEWCAQNGEDYVTFRDRLPIRSPSHQEVPYAFKAWALKEAEEKGYTTLLWADACILPIRSLEPLWERIERDGYWIGSQAGPEPDKGYTNYEWTADSACRDLLGFAADRVREINRTIPHVVATAFGVNTKHPTGEAIQVEYLRLAQTKAFCGPWTNDPSNPCGPHDVRGHRHDQTALSVIAWRQGCKLTRWPEVFAYRGHEDERTILVADGKY
jgi:hypothetical protein